MIIDLTCEVCKKWPAIGVACVPGVPMSSAYCAECLQANAHPWNTLVANTACIGGLDQAAEWWKMMVEDTCKHLGKSLEEFNNAVAEEIKAEEEYWKQHPLED